jgi:hypothetical protein
MTTLQTADGRLLRAQRPAGAGFTGSLLPGSFPPMWSDGETETGSDVLRSYEAIYRSQPILAGAVDKIARRAATLPFAPYRQLANGSRTALPREDSLATLLRRPRPRMSSVHLLAHVFQSLLMHGNALVAKLRGPDREVPPLMLWPLDWARVGAYGEPGGDIEWWSTFQFGEERFISAADTLHFAWPAPTAAGRREPAGEARGHDPARGRDAAVSDRELPQRQPAEPRGQPGAGAAEQGAARRRPREHRQPAQGRRPAGKTILLGAGAKVQPLSLSPIEAALIEQRKLNREEVAIVYDLGGPSLSTSPTTVSGTSRSATGRSTGTCSRRGRSLSCRRSSRSLSTRSRRGWTASSASTSRTS